jgi:hypothetical protein
MQNCNKGSGCLVCKEIIYDQCKECGRTAEEMGHAEFIEHVMTFCGITKPVMRVSG